MADVDVRHCWGQDTEVYDLAISASVGNPYGKLLRAAARLVKEHDPLSVTVTGPYLEGSSDTFRLEVHFTPSDV